MTAGGGPLGGPVKSPRDEPGRWLAGAVVAGRFRVVRLLGRGGMGEVYLAEDARLDRKIALKVLAPGLGRDPQYLQRFHREARAASALSHPHVCVIHEIGETEDGSPFMAMEFIEGESLQASLHRGPFLIADVVEIGIQVADALEAAHSKGIVHRDIKSANVVRSQSGLVKVLDFGLAKRIAGVEGAAALDTSSMVSTQTGMLLGTPCYMSPEQALARPVDHRSDIFSLGVLLYELVTGRLPFLGGSIGELTEGIVHAQPEAMARFNYELPPELDRIVRKCLEKPPERRYQSARELEVDLKSLRRDIERGEPRGATQGVPAATRIAPAAEPLPIEELKQSDVFLAYADVDDQPVVAGRQGWITQFHRNLRVRLEQLSGESVRIWPQANPLGRVSVKEEILRNLPEVKTLVSVLSPPFVRSDGCRSQVETFWRTAEKSGVLDVESRPRVFKVVKTPVESREYPRDVAPLLGRLKSFDFFEWDPETGRLREFDEAFGDIARQRYHERVYDVAHEIRQVLRTLRARATSAARTSSSGGKLIFLATTTADLAAQRDQLQRELIEEGHRIVPQGPLPIVASEIESAVRGHLEGCDLAIHLVGDRYGLVPEDTDLSVVALQNQLAGEASAGSGLARLVWMPRGLRPRDERQEAFLRDLVRNPQLHRGAEVISDTLENFKVLLRSRWSRELEAGDAPARTSSSPPRVYLICDPRDEAAIEPLEDFFYERGIEVSLPGFETGEAAAQDIHIRNLTDCDGALIYYGAGGSHWVDFNIRDLQKAAGYRGSVPIGTRAVYIVPPSSHRKERFKSVSVDVIRQAGETFDRAALEEFAGKLRAARGAAT